MENIFENSSSNFQKSKEFLESKEGKIVLSHNKSSVEANINFKEVKAKYF
jgi:hypothetical protein